MVTIIDYKERQKEDGTSFYVLEIQGGIDLVLSKTTGQYYVTAKRAFIPTTFNQQICSTLLGTKIAGSIAKQECDSYEYVVKETGEMITLSHRWVYSPEEEEKAISKEANDKLIKKAESLVQSVVLEPEFAL